MSHDGATRLILSHDVYDPTAVADAVEAYAHFLTIGVLRTAADETEMIIRDSRGGPAAAHVVGEFLNYLLDASIRRKLLED